MLGQPCEVQRTLPTLRLCVRGPGEEEADGQVAQQEVGGMRQAVLLKKKKDENKVSFFVCSCKFKKKHPDHVFNCLARKSYIALSFFVTSPSAIPTPLKEEEEKKE